MAGDRRVSWRPLPLAVQLGHLRHMWPDIKAVVHRGLLTAEGWVTPNVLAQPYRVSLNYRVGEAPKLWVREPQIVAYRSPGEPVPHVYDRAEDLRPCLYYPISQEWRSDKPLAMTILPWLLLWLSFYEIWLATGSWLGEGVEHGSNKRQSAEEI